MFDSVIANLLAVEIGAILEIRNAARIQHGQGESAWGPQSVESIE